MLNNFILASASPRRVELLKKIVPDFTTVATDVDETILPGESTRDATRRLATLKARAGFTPGSTTLGADTLVTLDGVIYGKPTTREAAREMLFQLAGKTHTVITSWCLKTDAAEIVGSDETHVTFRFLAFGEIEAYMAMCDPTQFAGAYAIQGAGRDFVEEIEGDLETVIGLPTSKILDAIKHASHH